MKQLAIILIISIFGIFNINAQELVPFREKKKLGFKDENGNIVVPPKYTFTYDTDRNGFCDFDKNGLCKVNSGGKLKNDLLRKGGKWGYINREGKEIIPIIYDALGDCVNDSIYIVKTKEKSGYISKTGRIIVPTKYDGIKPITDGRSYYGYYYGRNKSKYGVVNSKGIEIIPVIFNYVDFEADYGLFWCKKDYKKKDKIQLIDTIGKILTTQVFHDSRRFSDGYAAVKVNKYWGFIDTTGKTIIPNKYSGVKDFNNGIAIVNIGGKTKKTKNYFIKSYIKGGKWGFINDKGKEISAIKYDAAYNFSEGMAIVGINNKYGFINSNGEEISAIKYDTAFNFYEEMAVVGIDNKYGYINSKGEEIIPMVYDNVKIAFINGFSAVNINGKWSVINKSGEIITKKGYNNILIPTSLKNLIAIIEDKVGLIDTLGNELISPIYDIVGFFNNGMAYYNNGGLFGYIDFYGKEITDLKYSYIEDFNEFGISWAKVGGSKSKMIKFGNEEGYFVFDGKYVLVDTTGKEITSVKYDYVNDFHEGIATVSYKGKCGFVDKTGNELTPIKYDYVSDFKNGKAWANIGGYMIDNKVIGGSFTQINYKGEEIATASEYEGTDFRLNYFINLLYKNADYTINDIIPNIFWGY